MTQRVRIAWIAVLGYTSATMAFQLTMWTLISQAKQGSREAMNALLERFDESQGNMGPLGRKRRNGPTLAGLEGVISRIPRPNMEEDHAHERAFHPHKKRPLPARHFYPSGPEITFVETTTTSGP